MTIIWSQYTFVLSTTLQLTSLLGTPHSARGQHLYQRVYRMSLETTGQRMGWGLPLGLSICKLLVTYRGFQSLLPEKTVCVAVCLGRLVDLLLANDSVTSLA